MMTTPIFILSMYEYILEVLFQPNGKAMYSDELISILHVFL